MIQFTEPAEFWSLPMVTSEPNTRWSITIWVRVDYQARDCSHLSCVGDWPSLDHPTQKRISCSSETNAHHLATVCGKSSLLSAVHQVCHATLSPALRFRLASAVENPSLEISSSGQYVHDLLVQLPRHARQAAETLHSDGWLTARHIAHRR